MKTQKRGDGAALAAIAIGAALALAWSPALWRSRSHDRQIVGWHLSLRP